MKIKENWGIPFFISMGWDVSFKHSVIDSNGRKEVWFEVGGVLWQMKRKSVLKWELSHSNNDIRSCFPTGNGNTMYAQMIVIKREQNFKNMPKDQRKDSQKNIKQTLSIWGVYFIYIFILDNYICIVKFNTLWHLIFTLYSNIYMCVC